MSKAMLMAIGGLLIVVMACARPGPRVPSGSVADSSMASGGRAVSPSGFRPLTEQQVTGPMVMSLKLNRGAQIDFEKAYITPIVGQTPLVCSTIPSKDSISAGPDFHWANSLASTDASGQVKVVVANGSVANQTMALIVEYSKSLPCATQNPDVSLVYGYSVRIVVKLMDFDATVGSSFAAIAANGTIHNKSQSVDVSSHGFVNPKLDSLISTINGKDLNVETYAAFEAFLSAIALLPSDHGTTFAVRLLGSTEKSHFENAVAATFGLSALAQGKTCQAAKTSLPPALQPSAAQIDSVYVTVMALCDATTVPDGEFTANAKKRLFGLKVTH